LLKRLRLTRIEAQENGLLKSHVSVLEFLEYVMSRHMGLHALTWFPRSFAVSGK